MTLVDLALVAFVTFVFFNVVLRLIPVFFDDIEDFRESLKPLILFFRFVFAPVAIVSTVVFFLKHF